MLNRIRVAGVIASLWGAVLGSVCSTGTPPPEVPSPTATGIPSPLPASYAWVRAHLDGGLKGEFVTGDPQDSFERIRGKVEGNELFVAIGFDTRNVRFRTPPLQGGSRYLLQKGSGFFALTVDGIEWSTETAGVCSVIFGHVRGPEIPFFVPPAHQVYEADAGFVCAALESPARPGSSVSVIDGSLHFFFVVRLRGDDASGSESSAQRTSTGTIPPTG
jgi:hypothetical protein